MVVFNGDGFHEEVVGMIFGTVLMNFLNDSFTAHLGLPLFLARCILLTGLSLIPARALRLDSPDWQLQWRDTGGTVLPMNPTQNPCSGFCSSSKIQYIYLGVSVPCI